MYADPYGSFFASTTEDEYCTKEYSLEDFKIIKMAIPNFRESEWKWETDINKIIKKLNKIEKDKQEAEKQSKIKKELKEKYKQNRDLKLKDFLNKVNNEHEFEVKIDDKYYKIPCTITEIEGRSGMFGINTIIKFEVQLFRK